MITPAFLPIGTLPSMAECGHWRIGYRAIVASSFVFFEFFRSNLKPFSRAGFLFLSFSFPQNLKIHQQSEYTQEHNEKMTTHRFILKSGAGILPASLFFSLVPARHKLRGISSVARASRLRVGCFNWDLEFQLSRINTLNHLHHSNLRKLRKRALSYADPGWFLVQVIAAQRVCPLSALPFSFILCFLRLFAAIHIHLSPPARKTARLSSH
jgi:hypothetical protein